MRSGADRVPDYGAPAWREPHHAPVRQISTGPGLWVLLGIGDHCGKFDPRRFSSLTEFL